MNIVELKKFRKKLKKNKPIISSWSQLSDPNLLEIYAVNKFDCLTLDFEHGLFDISSLPNLIRVAEKKRKIILVRLPNKNQEICRQVLDAGVDGIIIPNIQNEVELEEIINLSLLPPMGKRGIGFSRTNNFGKNFDKYINSNIQPIIIAMIEDYKALEKLDKILNVNNLDGILIGPYDLSASLNKPGNFSTLEFKKTIKMIKQKCKTNKIICGMHQVEPDVKNLKKLVKEGYKFLPFSTDAFVMSRATEKLFKNKF